jgi:phosphoenolpyruvate carboxykinase (GTP)
MASETTAAATGRVGVVRRDPMAMLPFCGYNMGDYFRHWLNMGKKIPHPPKLFHVNWFRMDETGKFIWPGFGDNLRVLEWIIERATGKAEAVESPIGYLPKASSINLEGLNISRETLESTLLNIDLDDWIAEAESQREFFNKIGDTLPQEILQEHQKLLKRLKRGTSVLV